MIIDLKTITILVAICTLWHIATTWYALSKREKLATKVDDYLGSEGAPKRAKQFVFVAFDLTDLPFVFLRIFMAALKGILSPSTRDEVETLTTNRFKNSLEKMSEAQKSEFNQVMLSCFHLYFKRSPISSILVILAVSLVIIIAFFMDKLISTNYLKVLVIKSGQGIVASRFGMAYA
ncbi:hypothetical protein [Pseudoalteromonas peptidolytica]|uniref:hypothetical protein n=1 Tax=Pseudoalteromonas peptidolytica TaxID=61150 RepID=UPI00298ECAAD|nr:hypothetical protein [Pseudoalteromonas peptidolytica]MDW7548169.1 hypothetical protein [Pseudoalteromonas peptidolytica]